jgi:hypothetical protein
VRAIMERQLKARRLDCPLSLHRMARGKPGQQITDLRDVRRKAFEAAQRPAGRLFHDLRRSAVGTLIRAAVDESTAMKVSGQKTRSMLLRYNIVTEGETADALLRADAYLSTQPQDRNVERAQIRHTAASTGPRILTAQAGIGSSGRIRTEEQPSTPAEPSSLDPDRKPT